jgi:hypothetical protein
LTQVNATYDRAVGLPDPLEKFIDPNALHDRNEAFFAWWRPLRRNDAAHL